MKNYSEIYDIIYNKLGLVNLTAYKKYIDSFSDLANPRIPTPEEIELLNPDLIDNKAFWQVAEKIFGTDPVSNSQFGRPFSKRNSAKNNLSLYLKNGFIGCLQILNYPNKKLLEIGPGYGTLRQWVDVNSFYDYYGVDVYPKIDEIDQAEPNGLIGEVTKARKYDIVVAENVFQHLSVNQRRAYYKDIFDVLVPGGWFMVSQMYDHDKESSFRDKDGKFWMRHYGQFTEIQKPNDIKKDLALYFNIQSETYAFGHWMSIICQKKDNNVNH